MLNNITHRVFLLAAVVLLAGFFAPVIGQGERASVASFRKDYNFEMPKVNLTEDVAHVPIVDTTATSSEDSTGDYGVYYFYPPVLQSMMDMHVRTNRHLIVGPGFRVQIYAGSRLEYANEAKADFLQSFGDFDFSVYQKWQPPHFRVRVGDFLSRAEALREMATFRQIFPDAFIVEDEINLPKYKKQAAIPGDGGDELREN